MKNACNQILTTFQISPAFDSRSKDPPRTLTSPVITHTLPLSMSFKCLRAEDELGSGGKILRGGRFAVSASSPFVRPKSPPRSESPVFLTALFTCAGMLLSSVFVFSSSPSLSSSAIDICSASSDDSGYENDDDAYNGDENDDDDHVSNIHFKEAGLNQGFALGSQPVVQKSDAKLAIEQLILQETFSRLGKSRNMLLNLQNMIQANGYESAS